MKKEYIATLLFKNHRGADDMITDEQLDDLDQQQTTEAQNNSKRNNETSESSESSNKSSLPQRLLSILQKALEVLDLNRKG